MIGKKSPLYDWHAANGARFVEFGGWQLPEVYGKSVEQEYGALRNGAGLVDLCSEARYRIEGEDAAEFLEEILTIKVESIPLRQCRFSYILNDNGNIIDGVTVYRDQSYFLLLGNGSVRFAALDWLEQRAQGQPDLVVKVVDVTSAQGQIALIGPGSKVALDRISGDASLEIDPGGAAVATIESARCLVLRRNAETFDIVTGSIYIIPVWEKLAEVVRTMGARPIGFTAREILRLESGLPQFSLEIDEDTTPLEVNGGNYVDFTKPDFYGRRALMHAASAEFQRTMTAVRAEMDRPVDLQTEIVADGFPVGRITSFAISPVMRCKLALGFVLNGTFKAGANVVLRNGEGQTFRGDLLRPGQMPGR